MAGSLRVSLGVAALALVASSAEANGSRTACWPMPAMHSSYWWPAPIYYIEGVRVIPVGNSCESVPPPPPLPQTAEPPLHKDPSNLKPPLIKSTRSLSGSPGKERCSVGFWNLTGRDVTLIIDGRSFTLAKNRKMAMELEHQFSWQTDNGPQQFERVPDSQASYDVIVRE